MYEMYSKIHFENSSLILTCGFSELVTLCIATCICRKIPVRAPKWPPHLIFAGACHGQKTGTIITT